MSGELVDKFNLIGSTLDRKFRIERVIAEGGFGVLYYGTHLMLDRPIALKVLKTPPGFNEAARASFMEGFAREAKTIVRISHPNIVQVLDFGVSPMNTGEMAPWMALEWLNGPTLREVLLARRGQGGQSPIEVLTTMRPALEALAYAHEEGIAHRDLKPANMMLVPTKRGNVLKLLDFGIAKVMEEGEEAGSGATMTASSLQAFSLAYAAPEQIGGSRTGPWTDVHAMALIVTEMLTDHAPYDGKERTEICCDALSSRRPTPSKRNVDTGPWEHVLSRALALKPSDRYENAALFLQALEEGLASAGINPNPGRAMTGQYQVPGQTGQYGIQPGPGAFVATQQANGGMVPMPVSAAGHEPGGNPTTLRGATTGAVPGREGGGGGGAAKWIIGGLVLVGVLGGGTALALQMKARSDAEAAVAGASRPTIPVVPGVHVPGVPMPGVAMPGVPTTVAVVPTAPNVVPSVLPSVPVVPTAGTVPPAPVVAVAALPAVPAPTGAGVPTAPPAVAPVAVQPPPTHVAQAIEPASNGQGSTGVAGSAAGGHHGGAHGGSGGHHGLHSNSAATSLDVD